MDLTPFAERPAPFCAYTAEELWTDPYVAQRMLEFHLDGTNDLASHSTDHIERSVRWLSDVASIGPGSRVLDLGCGPGLYSNRFSLGGADVVGVDFSSNSLHHAATKAPSADNPTYVLGNYLDVVVPGHFDLVLLAMYDYCPLSPPQRDRLLERVSGWLHPGGRFVFDVYALRSLREREESLVAGPDLMNGFWSAEPYDGVLRTFLYPAERVGLDKYDIVERSGVRTIYNWLQYFDTDSVAAELATAGLAVEQLHGDLTGAPLEDDPLEFAVVASHR